MGMPEPPPYMEALTVWGWAVQHGGIPLDYAAAVLAEHAVWEHYGNPLLHRRPALAAEHLLDWENILVKVEWPGDEAIDRERWERPADWEQRDRLLADLAAVGLPAEDSESTEALWVRYLGFRLAQTQAQAPLRRPPDTDGPAPAA